MNSQRPELRYIGTSNFTREFTSLWQTLDYAVTDNPVCVCVCVCVCVLMVETGTLRMYASALPLGYNSSLLLFVF